MSRKKIIIPSVVAAIILGLGLLFWGSYGFTPKSRFTHCMIDCYDLMILESSKQYCPGKCTEIHKFNPTAEELNQIIAKINNENVNTNKSTAKNTNAAKKVNASTNTNSSINTNADETDHRSREYYCEWAWPQKIIDKNTQEVIAECTWDKPWCFFADYTYDKVGCCDEAEHINCITLPNLL